MTTRQRTSTRILIFLSVLMFVGIACAGSGASVPAQYVYWQAATETPTPTPRPVPIYCPGNCVTNGIIEKSCIGKIIPPYVDECQYKEQNFPKVPTATPFIRHYAFYRFNRMNLSGGLVIAFEGVPAQVQFNDKNYYILLFRSWNNSETAIQTMYPLSMKIRELDIGGELTVGNWGADADSPDVIAQFARPRGYLHLLWDDDDYSYFPPKSQTPDSGYQWVAAIQAPAGSPRNYLFVTDPLSKDTNSFVVLLDADDPALARNQGNRYASVPQGQLPLAPNAAPPAAGNNGGSYRAEMAYGDVPTLVPNANVEYYSEGEGSSSAYVTSKGIQSVAPVPNSASGAVPYDYATFVQMNGAMLPVIKAVISQNYGCTNWGTPNKCAYLNGGQQCSLIKPKCKDYLTEEPTIGWHNGIDIADKIGVVIYAAFPGTIVKLVGYDCREVNFYGKELPEIQDCLRTTQGYGFNIYVQDQNGYVHHYAHLFDLTMGVGLGSKVERGQAIAFMGNSGWSSGAHLHYNIMKPDWSVSVNPFEYLTTLVGNEDASQVKEDAAPTNANTEQQQDPLTNP